MTASALRFDPSLAGEVALPWMLHRGSPIHPIPIPHLHRLIDRQCQAEARGRRMQEVQRALAHAAAALAAGVEARRLSRWSFRSR